MATQSATPTYHFATQSGLALEALFDGGRLTSDGGLPWLAEADAVLGLCTRLAASLPERRRRHLRYSLESLVRQRVFQIACGYEDQNDADSLRHDAHGCGGARGELRCKRNGRSCRAAATSLPT